MTELSRATPTDAERDAALAAAAEAARQQEQEG
jgi:hypothetical protein